MKKVLIVEDSQFVAKAIGILLNANGITAEHTADGSKAHDLVKMGGFDMVILDLMMPNFSGKDVLVALKGDTATKQIPVMVLTAKADAGKWDKDILQCDKFMTKPFDNNELVAEVKKLLKI